MVARRVGQRPAAVTLVAFVHLIAVWAIFANIRPSHVFVPIPALQLTVLKPSVTPTSMPPLHELKLLRPKDAPVPPPEIQIAPDPDSPSMTTSMAGQVLPPRPDPYYINKAPEVPDDLRLDATKAVVTLRLLVQPDGFVEQAFLVKGTGSAALDKVALAFVEANWRFQPAMSGGKPVQAWTTVRVHFA
ncbi:MAG TPA: energy transducer TonB [Rhizomicrobium sp.]|nr:energy transducer TonB [Rhizomicrobium sp.]